MAVSVANRRLTLLSKISGLYLFHIITPIMESYKHNIASLGFCLFVST